MYEDAFIHINHTNMVTFRNTHDRFVHTYHTAHTDTHTAEAWSQMVFLCACSLGIHEDAGDICSTGARRGLGEVSGGKRNNHDFILVPNDCEIFLRHQRLVVVGAFLGASN